MWSTQRKNRGGAIMSYLDIFQIAFVTLVFIVGLVGFMKAATSDD